jgi:nitrate reductase delta subunit
MKTFKVLSALLTYPSVEHQQAAAEMHAVLDREAIVPMAERAALHGLIDLLASGDLYDLQECYGLLFDRTRSLSLHLFEHVHGEGRDRGQAMVDLLKLYEDAGYSPTTKELPDYLPLFLEFVSTREPKDALELVGQPANVFAALKERLAKRGSPYGAVMIALLAIGKAKLDLAALEALRAEPDPEPDDLEALDAAWIDEEVIFGPGAAAADCGKDGLAAKLRQARRPAPGLEHKTGGKPQTIITNSPATRV